MSTKIFYLNWNLALSVKHTNQMPCVNAPDQKGEKSGSNMIFRFKNKAFQRYFKDFHSSIS
jgi:hypothetical protein